MSSAFEYVFIQVCEHEVVLLGNLCGDVVGGFFDLQPVAFSHPVVDGFAVDLEEVGDLCLCEVGVEEEFFGGGLLLCLFHKK